MHHCLGGETNKAKIPPCITLIHIYLTSLLLKAMHYSGINEQSLKNTLEKFVLTLNSRNSETTNDKNNPKVPKFSSCRGLSSTLSRKCGRTTLCGCLWVFYGCLWVFVGVRGVTICDFLAQTCPWDHLARRRRKKLLAYQK